VNAIASRIRDDAGQALVLVVIGLTGFVGCAALVVDVGSWFQTQRQLQTAADAGALAGAQELPPTTLDACGPTDTRPPCAAAQDYSQQNYAGLGVPEVTFPSPGEIDVLTTTSAPGIFARIYGSVFENVTVRAHARAQVSVPLSMKNLAPVTLKDTQACFITNPSCFNQTVTLDFDYSNIASGMYGLINVECYSDTSSNCGSGGIGGNALQDVVENGWPGVLPSQKWYGIKTGNTVGPVSHGLQDAADAHKILLFPVWDVASAADRTFHIIGWAAFVIDPTGVDWGSQDKRLTGHFTTFIATDVAGGGGAPGATNDFGVHVVNLTQ
jgi:hypothetical protein